MQHQNLVLSIGWVVDTNTCPDKNTPRDIPCITRTISDECKYPPRNLRKIQRVSDLAYKDLDHNHLAGIKFFLCNMLTIDNSSGNQGITQVQRLVQTYHKKHSNSRSGCLVDIIKSVASPTQTTKPSGGTKTPKRKCWEERNK